MSSYSLWFNLKLSLSLKADALTLYKISLSPPSPCHWQGPNECSACQFLETGLVYVHLNCIHLLESFYQTRSSHWNQNLLNLFENLSSMLSRLLKSLWQEIFYGENIKFIICTNQSRWKKNLKNLKTRFFSGPNIKCSYFVLECAIDWLRISRWWNVLETIAGKEMSK